jgi:DNA-binding response OmpR family regulator
MAQEGAMVIMRGPDGTREWPVEGELVIGRDPASDICLPDRQVSRRHAVIRRGADGYEVVDNGSKNGLWLNGVLVEGALPLSDGDELSVAARFKLYFVDAEATAPIVFDQKGLRIDTETMDVYVNGRPLDPPLSGPQYELLRLLYRASGALVTRDDIVQSVWPEEHPGGVSEDAIDALILRLRMRLSEIDPDHQYIVTLRGYGFRFEAP